MSPSRFRPANSAICGSISATRSPTSPLVDLHKQGIAGDNYYARTDGSNPPYGRPIEGAITRLLARKSVAERLAAANRLLNETDLELYVVDAYRPVACQHGIWNFFWSAFRRQHPEASDAALEALVSRYVSDPRHIDPDDPGAWPPHSTGGAIDLTLRRRSTGMLLDMGTHIDDAGAVGHTDYFERLAGQGRISMSDQRLTNRRQLYWSMISAGFTNYSFEYWHYDYGNQMYVLNCRASGGKPAVAFYGYIGL